MVVKTLNHIGYHELDDERRPAGSPERRALGVAGDDPGAVEGVAEVIERIGYDAARLGSRPDWVGAVGSSGPQYRVLASRDVDTGQL